jgi:hypothetical protein
MKLLQHFGCGSHQKSCRWYREEDLMGDQFGDIFCLKFKANPGSLKMTGLCVEAKRLGIKEREKATLDSFASSHRSFKIIEDFVLHS